MNEITEPKLAAPGAGLPKIELFIARWLSRIRRWRGSREVFNANFNHEREEIRKLYQSCKPEEASRRVLIERPRGLEDSSRNWSVWMTLDHLRIVNGGMAKTIGALSKGIVPKHAASTAAVKPGAEVKAEVVAEYEASCDAVIAAVAAVPELKTTAKYAHPWFGPMNAFGWHALAGGHMAIHRVQLERILQGLTAQRN